MDPVSRVNKFLGESTSWLYALVFLITLFEVVSRYVFNAPTIWVLELSIALAGIQYAIGGAYAMQRDAHVRIDVIYNLCGPRLRAVFDIMTLLIVGAILVIIIRWGTMQFQDAITPTWQRTGSAWNSFAPVFMKAAIPIAGVLMLGQTLVLLVQRVRSMFS